MRRAFGTAILAAGLLAVAGSTTAQDANTEVRHTQTVHTEEAVAKSWRLTMEEWARYKEIMKGPRGIWTPHLDPITVLGIDAETDAERKRYAELLVTVEFDRVQKELEFQRAYDEAAKRLFPQMPRVTGTAAGDRVVDPLPGTDRIAFVGSVDPNRCPTCQEVLTELLQRFGRSKAPSLDLYLADAPTDDVLRTWAGTEKIQLGAVWEGRVTLNHAQGAMAPSASGGQVTPKLLQRIAGQWLPLGDSN